MQGTNDPAEAAIPVRVAIDVGGTFTDLVVESRDGGFRLFKSPTVQADPAASALDVIGLAATEHGLTVSEFLGQVEFLTHGTTRGLNAILTGETARTALVTTRGHPDILVFREGGRRQPFDNTRGYPPPYIPRRLTFEVTERIAADGRVLVEFDEPDANRVIEQIREAGVSAAAVCFLWSVVNPAHELRFGRLLAQRCPEIAVTLSHELNPTIREYRRASSASIDASLKPLISSYLSELGQRLRGAGFQGRPLMVTAGGGLLDFDDVIRSPIHSLGSGPAMAPVAGRHYALQETGYQNAVVADAGGTSYDVSLVRKGRIPWTRETWLGEEYAGHITGFPSIDVRSIGAGGGSIAWVDPGGLLHVGPASAGAEPGPACYGRGSLLPTVTDACLVLGYLNPHNFLGGRMSLDPDAASRAIERSVGRPLGLDLRESATAILEVVTENMAQAVEEVSVRLGVSPADAVLVAGGGSSGFNCVAIARRLGCRLVVMPKIAAGLSAAGGLLADLTSEVRETLPVTTADFDFASVNAVLDRLGVRCREFLSGPAASSVLTSVEYFAEARYPDQVWELEVPLQTTTFQSAEDVELLRSDFHQSHRDAFAVADVASPVEVITWGARARGTLARAAAAGAERLDARVSGQQDRRTAIFGGKQIECDIYQLDAIPSGGRVDGPAVVESPTTTVVLPEGAWLTLSAQSSLLINPSTSGSAL